MADDEAKNTAKNNKDAQVSVQTAKAAPSAAKPSQAASKAETTKTESKKDSVATDVKPKKSGGLSKSAIAIMIAAGVVVVAIIAAVAIVLGNNGSGDSGDDNSSSSAEQEYSTLKQIDVNGLTIAEACEKVRAEGWSVSEVAGNNDYSEKSDCSDKDRTVVKAYYHDEKYYSWGERKSDYETVSFRFQNEAKESTSSSSSSSSSNNSSSSSNNSSSSNGSNSSSSSSSKPSSSSSPSSSTGYQSIYNTYAARLRSECVTLSMTECAELANEGVEKMAEYMWKASGTDGQYETYSDWADKLYDVYLESAR